MPAAPGSKGKQSEFSIYENNFRIAKSEIYSTLWDLDYYILKASTSAMDFDYLMNKIKIKDLYPHIIKAFLEK